RPPHPGLSPLRSRRVELCSAHGPGRSGAPRRQYRLRNVLCRDPRGPRRRAAGHAGAAACPDRGRRPRAVVAPHAGAIERPRWRGDVLLVLSGFAYAAYSVLGRPILKRHPALPVTAQSILWAVPGLVPLVAQEWLEGERAAFSGPAVAGILYLGVVITALGY